MSATLVRSLVRGGALLLLAATGCSIPRLRRVPGSDLARGDHGRAWVGELAASVACAGRGASGGDSLVAGGGVCRPAGIDSVPDPTRGLPTAGPRRP